MYVEGAPPRYFDTLSAVTEPLAAYPSTAEVECRIRALAPAHTYPVFVPETAPTPDPPVELEATADGASAIVLTWRRAATGREPASYRVEVSEDGNAWTDLVGDTGGPATSYRHEGLPASTTRHYRVSARNVGGVGAPSAVATATTEAAE